MQQDALDLRQIGLDNKFQNRENESSLRGTVKNLLNQRFYGAIIASPRSQPSSTTTVER